MEATDVAMRMVPKKEPKERDAQFQTDQSSGVQEDTSQAIALLAYALWEQRGRPQGSAEQNWSEAEDQLRRHKIRAASVGE